MDLFSKTLEAYIAAHTTPENELLKEINRQTHLKVLQPRMLSGHLQGRILAMFSQMIRPKYILEIGTYTGYSALCLAEGLVNEGQLHTIDINEELESMVRGFFARSPYFHQMHYHIGNALEIIPNLNFHFDLIFIDADKLNYANYYDLVFEKVNQNGFIIIDNVLWDGKVLPQTDKVDKKTQAMIDFNQKIQLDSRVENILLPIRDGLMLVRKK